MPREDRIFTGLISYTTNVPTEEEGGEKNFIKCPVCNRRMVSGALHILGFVVNPAIKAREVAAWRMDAWGEKSILLKEDSELLSRKNIPDAVKVDFYCHDYQCLGIFFRNRYVARSSIQPYY